MCFNHLLVSLADLEADMRVNQRRFTLDYKAMELINLSELNCLPNALWTDGVLPQAVHFIGCVSGSVNMHFIGCVSGSVIMHCGGQLHRPQAFFFYHAWASSVNAPASFNSGADWGYWNLLWFR